MKNLENFFNSMSPNIMNFENLNLKEKYKYKAIR